MELAKKRRARHGNTLSRVYIYRSHGSWPPLLLELLLEGRGAREGARNRRYRFSGGSGGVTLRCERLPVLGETIMGTESQPRTKQGMRIGQVMQLSLITMRRMYNNVILFIVSSYVILT